MLCCWWAQVQPVACFFLYIITPVAGLFVLLRLLLIAKRSWNRDPSGRQVVGIFHPYCNAGGGGERVLWAIVQVLQTKFPDVDVVVYTGDVSATPEQIVRNVSQNLKMELVRQPRFVFLQRRKWVEAECYPICTLLGQSVGSVVLGIEALISCTPDYLIDTMGYSFTYPLFKVAAGCRVACYTHYPTISSDMLRLVSNSDSSFNNRTRIAHSPVLTTCKLIYYHLFALAYRFSGHFADLIMVNSHWTRDHMLCMWRLPQRTHLVFPPCDTSAFQSLSLQQKQRFTVVSVAQFRPEKEHKTQLLVFKRFTEMVTREPGSSSSQLVLIGSCRNQEDEERVADLRLYAQKLGLGEDKVKFRINIKFAELLDLVQQANMGIHTMRNEHFGIGVVELMAGGAIVVAHNSGGPQMDIVGPGTGYLATTVDEYAEKMTDIVRMQEHQLMDIRNEARSHVNMWVT